MQTKNKIKKEKKKKNWICIGPILMEAWTTKKKQEHLNSFSLCQISRKKIAPKIKIGFSTKKFFFFVFCFCLIFVFGFCFLKNEKNRLLEIKRFLVFQCITFILRKRNEKPIYFSQSEKDKRIHKIYPVIQFFEVFFLFFFPLLFLVSFFLFFFFFFVSFFFFFLHLFFFFTFFHTKLFFFFFFLFSFSLFSFSLFSFSLFSFSLFFFLFWKDLEKWKTNSFYSQNEQNKKNQKGFIFFCVEWEQDFFFFNGFLISFLISFFLFLSFSSFFFLFVFFYFFFISGFWKLKNMKVCFLLFLLSFNFFVDIRNFFYFIFFYFNCFFSLESVFYHWKWHHLIPCDLLYPKNPIFLSDKAQCDVMG